MFFVHVPLAGVLILQMPCCPLGSAELPALLSTKARSVPPCRQMARIHCYILCSTSRLSHCCNSKSTVKKCHCNTKCECLLSFLRQATKYHSLTSASAVSLYPGGGGGRTATISSGRPRSIDAEFILRMEQLGLSAHSMPPHGNNTFSGGKSMHA